MKRAYLKTTLALLIVATATSCYNLAPENTGMLTSADIYKGDGNVLNIDSLVDYIRSIHLEHYTNYSPSTWHLVETEYRYNGKHTKQVRIDCDLYTASQQIESGWIVIVSDRCRIQPYYRQTPRY